MAARPLTRVAVAAVATMALIALAGCATDPSSTPSATKTAAGMPLPKLSKELHNALPKSILDAGVLHLTTINLPPYAYKGEDGTTYEGINFDTVKALKAVLGIDVELDVAPSVADTYTGMTSGKYDANIAPLSDIPATQANYDFAVWIAEYVVFLQSKTAKDKIDSLSTACGHIIATLQGGTAQKVLEAQQSKCGNKPITISLFADQDTAVLAVKSGRADAAFSSQIPLTSYVTKDSSLKISGAGSTNNGFPPFWIGASAPKGAPIVPVLLDAFKDLKKAGTYDYILKKYHIEANKMDEFGFNLAKSQ